MRFASIVLLSVLIAAPACGGGGGGGSDPAGSPTPVAAGFTPAQASPGADTAAMAQGTTNNDVVTVNVTLTGVNGAFGTAFEVVFDNAHTVFVGFTHGTVFGQNDNAPNYTVGVDPQNPNRIVAGISHTQNTVSNVGGTATMVGLQFRVKQAGSYPLSIQNAVVYDGQSTPQPIGGISWFAGSVTGS